MTQRPFSTAYRWFVLLLLTTASTVSYVDRQILALMVGPVKRDIGITDTQISLLIGLAFTLVYSALMVPMGWLADKWSRRLIIGAGIFSWSGFTAACGLAGNYSQLFLARMGVGVGEATLAPAAYSLLADYFPRDRLPLAISVFSAAPFIGVGLANIVGGPLVAWLEQVPPIDVPLVGAIRSWQMTFIAVGLPGLLLAFAMLAVREPRRIVDAAPGPAAGAGERGDGLVAFLVSRHKFLLLHFTGFLFLAMQGYALFAWVIEFFIRQHGMARGHIGVVYGVIALLAGLGGSVTGGALTAWMMRRGSTDASLRVVIGCALVVGPIAAAVSLVSEAWLAIALLVPVTFVMSWPPGLSVAALQVVVPNRIRARVTALYLLAVTMVAVTLGPLAVGVLNDYVFADEKAIGKTLAVMACINYPMAAVCLLACLRHFRAAWPVSCRSAAHLPSQERGVTRFPGMRAERVAPS